MMKKILSVDTSSKPCSVCIYDGIDFNEISVLLNKTHSETLIPLLEELKENYKFKYDDIDYFAVNVGPGSFTGIRIGVSTIKGIASVSNKPCVSVSTLESLAYNLVGHNDSFVCPLIDARNDRFYFALFKLDGNEVERVLDDDVSNIDEIIKKIIIYKNVFLVGDGAKDFFNKRPSDSYKLAPEDKINQKSSSTAKAAIKYIEQSKFSSADLVNPVYLRPSQAERELIQKEKKQ